jgi:hypothetical protein
VACRAKASCHLAPGSKQNEANPPAADAPDVCRLGNALNDNQRHAVGPRSCNSSARHGWNEDLTRRS